MCLENNIHHGTLTDVGAFVSFLLTSLSAAASVVDFACFFTFVVDFDLLTAGCFLTSSGCSADAVLKLGGLVALSALTDFTRVLDILLTGADVDAA